MGRRVWLRPGVREFLTAVRPHFEVVLFTAATQNWAAAALEQLDPSAYLFDVMLHRDHTTSDLMWDYVKDLSRLGRDLSRVVIVDDNPLMFMYQPHNALHVQAYEAAAAGGADNVLDRVTEVLVQQIALATDVREVLGPMAAAKSCIMSTLGAAAAAEAAAPAIDQAVAGEQVPVAEEGTESPDASHSCGAGGEPPCSSCGGVEGLREGRACTCDPSSTAASGPAGAGAPAAAEEPTRSEAGDGCDGGEDGQRCQGGADADPADDCCAAAGSEGAPEEGEEEGEGEDDGEAVAYDANGIASRLGGDDEPAGLLHCLHGDGAVDSELHCVQRQAEESGQDGDEATDAEDASEEEEVGAGTEDFDALMNDAIAEYDSDPYEGHCHAEYEGDEAERPDVGAATAADFPPFSAAEEAACGDGALRLSRSGLDATLQVSEGMSAQTVAEVLEASLCASGGCGEGRGACAEHAPVPLPSGMVFLTDLNPPPGGRPEPAPSGCCADGAATAEGAEAGPLACHGVKRPREPVHDAEEAEELAAGRQRLGLGLEEAVGTVLREVEAVAA